jgi:hypothetical protein
MPGQSSSQSSGAPDFKVIARIAQRIRLQDVSLRWSQLGKFNEEEAVDPDWARKAFLSFDSRAVVDDSDVPAGEHFFVQCLFQLQFFSEVDSSEVDQAPDADEDSPPDIAIEAVFDLMYRINDWEGIEPDDLQHFAMANGTHNAWPYWREFAQSMSLRLGLKPFIAGPFKLPSSDDPKASDQDAE